MFKQTKRTKSAQVMLDWIGNWTAFHLSPLQMPTGRHLCAPHGSASCLGSQGASTGASELKPPDKGNIFLLVSCPLISGERTLLEAWCNFGKPGEMRLQDLAKGMV